MLYSVSPYDHSIVCFVIAGRRCRAPLFLKSLTKGSWVLYKGNRVKVVNVDCFSSQLNIEFLDIEKNVKASDVAPGKIRVVAQY